MSISGGVELDSRADELKSAIAETFHLARASIAIEKAMESSSYLCWRIEIPGKQAPRRLFVKDWGRPLIRKSDQSGRLRRELFAYNQILLEPPVSAPRLVCSIPNHAPVWLVFEAIDGQLLAEAPVQTWHRVGRWLAEFQAWLLARSPRVPDYLRRYDAASLRIEAWRAATTMAGSAPHQLSYLQPALTWYLDALEEIDRLPTSIVHGSFRERDILVSRSDIFPVDWERTGVGSLLFDIGYLTAVDSNHAADAAISGYFTADLRPPSISMESLAVFRIHGWMSKLRKAARRGDETRLASVVKNIAALAGRP